MPSSSPLPVRRSSSLSLSLPQRRPTLHFPDHLSYSSLSSFLACPMGWAMGRMERRPSRQGCWAFLGNTVHHVIETYHRGTITAEEAPAYYRVAWEEQRGLRESVEWADIDWGVKDPGLVERNYGQVYRRGKALVSVYFSGPHRTNVPLVLSDGSPACELNIEIPLLDYGGRRLKTFVAILDLIHEDQSIRDYKTRQMLLPNWIAKMEDFMDRVEAAADPRDVLYLEAEVGDHCDHCAFRESFCPIYTKEVV
jgi:hypothetical protein